MDARTTACRAGFIALGVIPTLVFAGLSLVVNLPAYHAWRCDRLSESLSHRLGMTVRISRLTCESGGSIRLDDIQIEDPETSAELCRIRSATAFRSRNAWQVVIPEMTLRSDLAPRAAALAHEHLLRRWSVAPAVELAVERLTLQASSRTQTLTAVHADWSRSREKAVLGLVATLPGNPEPTKAVVVRSRQAIPATTRIELQTGGPLPCSALIAIFPDVPLAEFLGEFNGTVRWQQSADGWNAELAGKFLAVELDDLVTRCFPHRLSGQGRIVIDRARVVDGQLQQLDARMVADSGVVSRSLVDAAIERLGLSTPGTIRDQSLIRFDRLDFRVQLDQDRLRLTGAAPDGTVVGLGATTLSASGTDVSTLALLQTLVPQRDLAVPTTRETQRMAAFVRLPSSRPRPTPNAYVPVRLRE